MDIVDHLEQINSEFEDVRVVLFADLSTQLVLADEMKKETGQEHLDEICNQAAVAFKNPFTNSKDTLIEKPSEVIVMNDDGILVSLRPTYNSATAICLSCGYNIDIDSVLVRARKALSETGAA